MGRSESEYHSLDQASTTPYVNVHQVINSLLKIAYNRNLL
ncbi:hypothetical protein FM106_18585 [Brachybacterium faecium]|nr:hypothetical protein FM106_18585 [Brachybacterium faecium]